MLLPICLREPRASVEAFSLGYVAALQDGVALHQEWEPCRQSTSCLYSACDPSLQYVQTADNSSGTTGTWRHTKAASIGALPKAEMPYPTLDSLAN